MYQEDLAFLAAEASAREEENDHFIHFIHRQDDKMVDRLVHNIYEQVSAAIDCTQCGNCCRTLVINVQQEEIPQLAAALNTSVHEVKEKYIEESMAGNCFINTVPCHFFVEKKCTIYAHRFTECRDFPHLHKPGFSRRLPGTLMHYGRCPIIYNVIEEVKVKLGFRPAQ